MTDNNDTLRVFVQFVYVAQAFAPSLDVTLDALYEVRLAVYRKSGNSCCKNIFVVDGGYEN